MAINKVVYDGDTLIDLTGDTVTADKLLSGYTAHNAAGTQINGSIQTKTASNMTVSGATVTAPAGYYSQSASKAVATGTAGTPTATKGTVANNKVTVTPSVQNTTGYITGGTKTGTAVTVQASELVSGTSNITSNGTFDITNYKSVSVNVSGGGGSDEMDILINRTISNYVNSTVKTIGSYAFNGCKSLISVSFSNCTIISMSAFAGCTALENAVFPKGASIASYAFSNCSKLASISFPAALRIYPTAFAYCSTLSTASFPKLTNISISAFYRCYNLVSLYLTNSTVCSLAGSNAFSSTPIGGYRDVAGKYGSIYVPASLLASYKAATNWTYFSGRFVGQ